MAAVDGTLVCVDTGVFHQTVGTLESICTLRDVEYLLRAASSIESPVEKT